MGFGEYVCVLSFMIYVEKGSKNIRHSQNDQKIGFKYSNHFYKMIKLNINQLFQIIIEYSLHACNNGYFYKPLVIWHLAVKKVHLVWGFYMIWGA